MVQCYIFFFFNDTATTEIYTRSIVGSVRCVQETGINAEYMGPTKLFRQFGTENIAEIFRLSAKLNEKGSVAISQNTSPASSPKSFQRRLIYRKGSRTQMKHKVIRLAKAPVKLKIEEKKKN
eukprot:TRINITY_DN8152_c0_g1_i1.p3 TRINITY_DN8152_c0_g1~~TRINITY_DN8152_c0_g1_i1.p3  ORF type:complete len:122 (+),score=34.71 TRINITY_DN8152_c0_g1_i1:84-449(+)